MSNVHKFLVILVIIALTPLLSHAKIPFTGNEEQKIGYVNIFKALNESKKGKEAKAKLEQMRKEKLKEIEKKRKDIESLKEELIKQSSVLSEGSRKDKQLKLEKLERDYKRAYKDAQYELNRKEMELTSKILKEIREVVREIGKEGSYTIILTDIPISNLSESGGLLLYIDKKIDITDEVIKRYNARAGEK
ncbi:MAG: OmpH family outer membrane protein [Nitrospirae bacterium]|nr:MAG: OmpH family outer membrane protein [Nitrospirota bacterium]